MPAPSDKFVFAGRLYTSHNGSNDTKDDRFVNVPGIPKLDFAYKQLGALNTSGGGASSPLTAGDIPPAFYVECGGTDDGGKRWAVLHPYSGMPILTGTGFNAEGEITQYTLTLGLYSDAGNGFHGGSNTHVDVWYLPKH